MRTKINCLLIHASTLLTRCANNNSTNNPSIEDKVNSTSNDSSQTAGDNGIAGEWKQQYTCFDKNGNYKLEPEEQIASGTWLGFYWFRFNADGSCQRDKDIKFKGTYAVEEKMEQKNSYEPGLR